MDAQSPTTKPQGPVPGRPPVTYRTAWCWPCLRSPVHGGAGRFHRERGAPVHWSHPALQPKRPCNGWSTRTCSPSPVSYCSAARSADLFGAASGLHFRVVPVHLGQPRWRHSPGPGLVDGQRALCRVSRVRSCPRRPSPLSSPPSLTPLPEHGPLGILERGGPALGGQPGRCSGGVLTAELSWRWVLSSTALGGSGHLGRALQPKQVCASGVLNTVAPGRRVRRPGGPGHGGNRPPPTACSQATTTRRRPHRRVRRAFVVAAGLGAVACLCALIVPKTNRRPAAPEAVV